MIEHRLIERMVDLMREELRKVSREKKVEPGFIDLAVDFIRTYADRCHHGKEEDILFRDLAKKRLSHDHEKTMDELIEEHIYARKTVAKLVSAKEGYLQGNTDALKDIVACIKELVEFYPVHIKKEDKQFFVPCMEYFSKQEQADMLQEFWNFDRNLIHEKYRGIVERLEAGKL
jgi:hemerythrin-like domain-containing protein